MLRFEDVAIAVDAFRLNANLSIEKGASVAIIGASGSGKSTLLSALAGFVQPVSGRILWDGNDLTRLIPAERPVSMVFQDHNLFPHLNIAQNVGLALRPALKMNAAEMERIENTLVDVGLGGMAGRLPLELSGGQQSRAALARVLLADRPLVVLDEPFSALGPSLRDQMLDLVDQTLTQNGRTVLMVTHDPADAKRAGRQIVFLDNGVATGPVEAEALFADPPDALRDYLGRRT